MPPFSSARLASGREHERGATERRLGKHGFDKFVGIEHGEIRFRLPDGEERHVIVSDGMMNVENNRVDILAFSAERPDEIDIKAAERELEIAREQLQQKQSLIEYNLSSASMARAMARLSGARRLKSDDPL